jgi:DNA replication protein DnaC
MLNQTTLTQLRTLKLFGFAGALEEQAGQANIHSLGFEERLALLVDREVHARDDRKRIRLLQKAKLKYPQAAIEDLDTRPGRGIDRNALFQIALSDWVERGDTLLMTGATGVGKTWLACALAQHACRRGHSAFYMRVPRMAGELKILHGSGAFGRWLIQLAKTELLVLDDWGVSALDATTRSDLLEIIDDRAANKATIITTQLPVDHWHGWIGDETVADAILDRVMQRVHRINLSGDSLRLTNRKTNTKEAKMDRS